MAYNNKQHLSPIKDDHEASIQEGSLQTQV
jgi:hypothetical protein